MKVKYTHDVNAIALSSCFQHVNMPSTDYIATVYLADKLASCSTFCLTKLIVHVYQPMRSVNPFDVLRKCRFIVKKGTQL